MFDHGQLLFFPQNVMFALMKFGSKGLYLWSYNTGFLMFLLLFLICLHLFILFYSNIEDMAREAISLDVEEETLDSELIPSRLCFSSFLSFFLVT